MPVDLPASRSRWKRFTQRVHRLHVGHRGDYSVERLIALEAYCRDVSFLRVLVVILMFPLPTLGMAILIECIPLKDPKEGWQINYAAFIRFFFECAAVAIGGVLQVQQLVPGINLPIVKTVLVAVGVAFVHDRDYDHSIESMGFSRSVRRSYGYSSFYTIFLLLLSSWAWQQATKNINRSCSASKATNCHHQR